MGTGSAELGLTLEKMNKRERILKTLQFEQTDRVCLLGGWIIDDRHHRLIAGVTDKEYWRDPGKYSVQAHRSLDIDGMIGHRVPKSPGDYRGGRTKETFDGYKDSYSSPEDVLDFVRSQPSGEEAVKSFDAAAWLREFREHVLAIQQKMGDMVYLPILWEIVHPRFEWYPEFGYENYLMFMRLYPEAAGHFFQSLAGVARRKAELLVDLYQKLELVPLTLIGTDIFGRDGPLISPEFLREFYFPHVRHSLEPFREAGIRTVWHSDGYIQPIVTDILSCGVSGFQGFQLEYGVDVEAIARHRTLDGERLTIFAGPSTAATLSQGTTSDVRRDVDFIIDTLAHECALFILPANHILPDCPVENIVEMYRRAAAVSGGL